MKYIFIAPVVSVIPVNLPDGKRNLEGLIILSIFPRMINGWTC